MAPKNNGKTGTDTKISGNTGGSGAGRLLSVSDLIRGGDSFTRVDLPEISVGGEPGYVYIKPLTSRMVVEFLSASKDEATPEAQNDAMIDVIAKCVCDEDGNALFNKSSAAQLKDVRMSAFNRISAAIMKEMNAGNMLAGDEGKAGSEAKVANSSASPTV